MTDHFRSQRLVYRAIENPEDLAFFQAIHNDRLGYQNSTMRAVRLPNKTDALNTMKRMSEENLLGAVICVPAHDHQANIAARPEKLTPIGKIHLTASSTWEQHHRNSEIGINILPQYQGKGYGSEAIAWVTDFAFRRIGLHRLTIRTTVFNVGAAKLYEKLGFKHEGFTREAIWHDGQWWDIVNMGMLDREWKEMQRLEKGVDVLPCLATPK